MSSYSPVLFGTELVSRRGFWEQFAKSWTKESAGDGRAENQGEERDHQDQHRPTERHAPQSKP